MNDSEITTKVICRLLHKFNMIHTGEIRTTTLTAQTKPTFTAQQNIHGTDEILTAH